MDLGDIKEELKAVETIYVASYNPLCYNETGRNAVNKDNDKLSPFVDASCRREPDLMNPFPSISAICRKDKFAPYLNRPGKQAVVYITNKCDFGIYGSGERENKFVAILKVNQVFRTHEEAYEWYLHNDIDIPSNCMVCDTGRYPYKLTAGFYRKKNSPNWVLTERQYFNINESAEQLNYQIKAMRAWDSCYKDIIKEEKCKCFIKTTKLYSNLLDPVVITQQDFKTSFGKNRNQRRPFIMEKDKLISFLEAKIFLKKG